MEKKILVLNDSRISNLKQSLALANEIAEIASCSVEVLDITFTLFAFMPNIPYLHRLYFKNKNPKYKKYDFIISCGRKLANASVYYKKHYGSNDVKSISILKPNLPFAFFDAVILPSHDGIFDKPKNNIVNVNGAITSDNFGSNVMDKSADLIFDKFEKPYIGVMIGGNSGGFRFTNDAIIELSKRLDIISKNMNASLFITTSRRTPRGLLAKLTEYLNCSYYIYDFHYLSKGKSPYSLFLKNCDYFVVTADSISMISEVHETKKPVYVFSNGIIKNSKHSRFLNTVVQNKSVKLLSEWDEILSGYDFVDIDCMKSFAMRVLEKMKSKSCN